ncbi:MAG: RNA methyltransferase [Termitinemataceae bacterium]|nr:MAG: RNA methyltransferase [Termitinemataceae bacterium]
MFNRLVDELAVCGFNAVRAVADVHPDTINRLFLTNERLPQFTDICRILAERKRPYKICESDELEKICKTSHHQGIVAMICEPQPQPLGRDDLDEWSAGGHIGIVLHSVGNDHNLGAIVRSAAFFDTKYVVISQWCKPALKPDLTQQYGKNAPARILLGTTAALTHETAAENAPETDYSRLTTASYRVAEGGFEYVQVRQVRRTAKFLKDARDSLIIIGTDHRARLRIKDLSNIVGEKREAAAKKGKNVGIALVVGNEENGLPDEIKDYCTALLRIPGTGNIESLNVAQAASLFLHEIYEM